MRRLANRVAVVTGAASGIGRATALALAAKGCALAIADVDELGLAQSARMIAALGRPVSQHIVDVSDKQRMQAFVDEVLTEHGRVHIVVNNAGVTVISKFEHHSIEDFERIVAVNLWGVVYGCKYFLPHLQAEGWGSLVNVSSMFGFTGVPKQSSYCATKFAVRGFSESLAIELANENIDVLTVHPGGIATNIVRNAVGHRGGKAHAAMVRWFDRRGMAPEIAGAKIVRAIERRQQRLVITKEAVLTDIAKRLIPTIPRRVAILVQRSKFM